MPLPIKLNLHPIISPPPPPYSTVSASKLNIKVLCKTTQLITKLLLFPKKIIFTQIKSWGYPMFSQSCLSAYLCTSRFLLSFRWLQSQMYIALLYTVRGLQIFQMIVIATCMSQCSGKKNQQNKLNLQIHNKDSLAAF